METLLKASGLDLLFGIQITVLIYNCSYIYNVSSRKSITITVIELAELSVDSKAPHQYGRTERTMLQYVLIVLLPNKIHF